MRATTSLLITARAAGATRLFGVARHSAALSSLGVHKELRSRLEIGPLSNLNKVPTKLGFEGTDDISKWLVEHEDGLVELWNHSATLERAEVAAPRSAGTSRELLRCVGKADLAARYPRLQACCAGLAVLGGILGKAKQHVRGPGRTVVSHPCKSGGEVLLVIVDDLAEAFEEVCLRSYSDARRTRAVRQQGARSRAARQGGSVACHHVARRRRQECPQQPRQHFALSARGGR